MREASPSSPRTLQPPLLAHPLLIEMPEYKVSSRPERRSLPFTCNPSKATRSSIVQLAAL